MKNILLLITIFVSNFSFSQTNFSFSEYNNKSYENLFKDELNKNKSLNDQIYNYIVKIDVDKNKYLVYYAESEGEEIKIDTIPITYGKTLSLNQYGIFSLSLFTTPFKIRPKQEEISQEVKSDLKNIGLFASVFYAKRKSILNDGSTREHKGSLGFFISPTSEEFNPENTNGIVQKSNKLVISTGLALSYTYKSIVLSYIPLGFDFGTNSDKKHWIYNEKRWWGFGIGLDGKFFVL